MKIQGVIDKIKAVGIRSTAFGLGICSLGFYLFFGLGDSFTYALADERLRPPQSITCSPNQLTSWQGVLVNYRRDDRILSTLINTFDGTQESLIITYQLEDFLIDGQPFSVDDWVKIESAKGVVRPQVSVRVWLCHKGDKMQGAVIDWQSPKH
ncbi:hypothetical protein K0I73_03830 [Shewanella mesophila]|uniref:hypothetical protein n=1 Tax=Shewanella mesophila TaxID=2864208 RepID=UPI001C6607E5|nr:hypothetical protein [Shewanella mesophila]QYJ86882.1 hypothetical protein K0I73_03830 [Shewanella mesophila]